MSRRRLSAGHVVTALALLHQALAFGVQLLVARRFAVQSLVDAWMAASAVTGVLAAVGAAVAGQLVVPVLTEAAGRGEEGLRRAAAQVTLPFAGLGVLLAAPLVLAPEPVLARVVPGLEAGARTEAAWILRWLGVALAASLPTLTVAQVAHVRGRFVAVAATAPLLAAVQVGAFALAPEARALHWMVLVQAVTAWAVLPLLVLVAGPFARPRGFAAARPLLGGALAVIAISASVRVNQAVDTAFASLLPAGHLAALGYATRLTTIVQAVLAAPVISVVFASIARLAAEARWHDFAEEVAGAMERAFFFSVGAAMLLVGLGGAGARWLLGPEVEEGVRLVDGCLIALAGIVVLGVWGSLLTRVCFTSGQRGLAVWLMGVIPMLANALLDFLLVHRLGVVGLAAVTSLNALVGLPLLEEALRRRGVLPKRIGPLALRWLLAAAPVALALRGLAPEVEGGTLRSLLHILLSAALGSAAYLGLARLLGADLRRILWGPGPSGALTKPGGMENRG